ncbi:hypothetical protein AVEN_137703-1, partial [Araneus ventricosus]
MSPCLMPLQHPYRLSGHGTAHIHSGSSVESGFEPGNHQPRSRILTTRPPWPQYSTGSPP